MLAALLVFGCDAISSLGGETPPSDDETEPTRDKRARDDDDDDDASDERRDRKVLRELEKRIHKAQHDGFIEGDAESYWKIYSKDGQVVSARGENPHPYDFLIPAMRARAFVKLRDGLGKVGPPNQYEQRYTDATQSLEGEKAVFRWTVHNLVEAA